MSDITQDTLNEYAAQTDKVRDSFLADAEKSRQANEHTCLKDDEMYKMYESDAEDAEHVACLLREGKWNEAKDVVRRLDTSPRECYDWYYSDNAWD